MDIEQIRADWHKRGFSCDVWVDPPEQRWENFVNRKTGTVSLFPVLGFAGEESKLSPFFDLEGRMEFEIEGTIHHPDPGEELFIPAGAVHSARNIGKVTARWLYGYGAPL